MAPQKLAKFVNYNELHIQGYNDKADGFTILNQMKFNGYTNMFDSLFDKNRIDFDDCAVTNGFKKKFKPNLFYYFKFNDAEDSSINCGVDDDALLLDVTEAGNFEVGEPGYIFYHHFHYILDEEGNVDDVIFDYTEQ